jgi:omega-6 fatty acid desaturase (delta-12 desaturase)
MTATPETKKKVDRKEWVPIVKQYQQSDSWHSTRQVLNSVIPFFGILVLMYYSLEISYWLTLALSVVNAGFITRIFIIQHDCGHNSFYDSMRANNIVGSIFGVITLTPYYLWRRNHAKHHATSGNLDSRGVGDVYTMTVSEYQEQSAWEQFKYRFYRHPLTLFIIGPIAIFFVSHRFALKTKKSEREERASVYWTNLALAVIIVGFGLLIGFKEFFIITIPMYLIAFSGGIYLFYVQHQFEDTYWRRKPNWDYFEAAMEGASYFKLPKLLQWFSGNIGFHHIHHLSPKIPNYLLEKAYKENDILRGSNTLTLFSSLKSVNLRLWDEQRNKLISFKDYRRYYQAAGT